MLSRVIVVVGNVQSSIESTCKVTFMNEHEQSNLIYILSYCGD